MSQGRNTNDAPWWETELDAIRREQYAYLRRRLPTLRADHEDLISDTFLALTKQIRLHSSGLPESWAQRSGQPNEAERSHLHKLAMIILKRRVADLFRKRASSLGLLPTGENVPNVAVTTATAPGRKIMLRMVLEVTLSILGEMKSEDRDLIALVSEDVDFRKALNGRDRQRLHRLRRRLRNEIARRFGAEVEELLRVDL